MKQQPIKRCPNSHFNGSRSDERGAILFRDTRGRREYLLLKSRPGDWEFPKGGVEGEEELQQTAIREVTEESGISDFRLIDGFRREYDYVFQAGGETIHKTVHLFIAESAEASAELSTNIATTSGAITSRRSTRSPRTARATSSGRLTTTSTMWTTDGPAADGM